MDNRPIIRSLLDLDFYKLTMLQVIWKYWRDIPIKFQFINRDKAINIAECVREEDLRAELNHIKTLRFKKSELLYLRKIEINGKKVFSKEFIDFLRDLELTDFNLSRVSDTYDIFVEGPWAQTTLWETLILSAVNELCQPRLAGRRLHSIDGLLGNGRFILSDKIKLLKQNPEIRFTEFGTRRRFSRAWQKEVLITLIQEIPGQVIGTSNVLLAKQLGIRPIGTFAHELFMVMYGFYYETENPALEAHNEVLRVWWETYGEPLSICLNETYGSDFFFKNLSEEQAENFRGFRLDSGDPFIEGEKAISKLEELGIAPLLKYLFFSDSLDINLVVELENHFGNRVKTGYGIGTNLTNDMGIDPLKIVVKIVEANGHPTPKLSNNIEKATGLADEIERCKTLVGYSSTFEEKVKY